VTRRKAQRHSAPGVSAKTRLRQRLGRARRIAARHIAAAVPYRSIIRALRAYPQFFRDRRGYLGLGGERLAWSEQSPQLLDRTSTSPFDSHYTYQDAWAARKVFSASPSQHVDVGSRISYVVGLTAFVPVTFVDIRPLGIDLEGLTTVRGDLLSLPFESRRVRSLSCLHVAEHVGLGRYGDPPNPAGTRQAAEELQRILAPNGDLYFSLPIGRPRVIFNAHRVLAPEAVLNLFPELDLADFAAVDDDGRFLTEAAPGDLSGQEYACGLYHFRRR
jgi:SAM-dependent methyltransferase